jgi:signal peptidase
LDQQRLTEIQPFPYLFLLCYLGSAKLFNTLWHFLCNNTYNGTDDNKAGEILASSKPVWSNILKNSYVKTVILAVIIIGGVMGFWLGLKAGLRTEYPLLTVASGSMIPTLNIGDLIVVQGVLNASELNVAPKPDGEIIVFKSPRMEGELIVHRAVYKEFHDGLWYFRTQGDANYGPDSWWGSDTWNGMISQNRLVGRVVGKAPWIGYIPLKIRSPEGIAFIVILIVLILLAEYLPVLLKKRPEQS